MLPISSSIEFSSIKLYVCRWVVESRLDELKFARSKSAYCYFSAAASIFLPELSDARISWAKNGVLTTVIDDFFDIGGSIEEVKLLIQLVETYELIYLFFLLHLVLLFCVQSFYQLSSPLLQLGCKC